eukprot:6213121-Pleurochrysis_carterae.AAC.1
MLPVSRLGSRSSPTHFAAAFCRDRPSTALPAEAARLSVPSRQCCSRRRRRHARDEIHILRHLVAPFRHLSHNRAQVQRLIVPPRAAPSRLNAQTLEEVGQKLDPRVERQASAPGHARFAREQRQAKGWIEARRPYPLPPAHGLAWEALSPPRYPIAPDMSDAPCGSRLRHAEELQGLLQVDVRREHCLDELMDLAVSEVCQHYLAHNLLDALGQLGGQQLPCMYDGCRHQAFAWEGAGVEAIQEDGPPMWLPHTAARRPGEPLPPLPRLPPAAECGLSCQRR